MNPTITYTGQLVTVTCWCGIIHAIPEGLRTHQLSEQDANRDMFVYCPLGHRWVPAGKSQVKIERERVARLERAIACRDEDVRAERASHAATKGKLTKTKNRIAAGTCPCCNRTFVQLSRHIATKHPEFKP